MARIKHIVTLLGTVTALAVVSPAALAASGDAAYRPGTTTPNPKIRWGAESVKPNPRINWGIRPTGSRHGRDLQTGGWRP